MRDGTVVTEVLVGPNNTTVTSVNIYNIVESIYVDTTLGTAAIVGFGSTGATGAIPSDWMVSRFNVGILCVVTGTINYTVQYTFDPIQDPTFAAAPVWVNADDSAVVSATATANTNFDKPVAAWQFVINSSAGGSLISTIIENGITG